MHEKLKIHLIFIESFTQAWHIARKRKRYRGVKLLIINFTDFNQDVENESFLVVRHRSLDDFFNSKFLLSSSCITLKCW